MTTKVHSSIDLSELKRVTEMRLNETGVWWALRRNARGEEAFSCRHAVTLRDRLGSGMHGGIPLWSELKTEIGIIKDNESGIRQPYAAHTRANTFFDKKKIAAQLGIHYSNFEIDAFISDVDAGVEVGESSKRDSPLFGLVNPFDVDILFRMLDEEISSENIWQLFDQSLNDFAGHPNTVMTNVGDRCFAIEIEPSALIEAISSLFPKTRVGEYAYPDPIWLGREGQHPKKEWLRFPPPYGPTIGILTGNSPESGLTLWKDFLGIYRELYRNTADVLMPEVIVYSIPGMGLSMELVERENAVWASMESALLKLLNSGCKIITLACNTTVFFEPKINALCDDFGANFVSIAEACVPAIVRVLSETDSRDKGVGLVGIGPVIDVEGGYSGYAKHLNQSDIKITPCPGDELAYLMKNIGIDREQTNKAISDFRRLMNSNLPNVEVVVLALTEISLVYRGHIETLPKKHKPKKIFIDALHELARYLVLSYIKEGLRKSRVCQIPEDFDLEDELVRMMFSIEE